MGQGKAENNVGVGLLQQPGSLLLLMTCSDSNCQDCPPVFTEENPTHHPANRFLNNVLSDKVDAKNAMNLEKHAGMYCFCTVALRCD